MSPWISMCNVSHFYLRYMFDDWKKFECTASIERSLNCISKRRFIYMFSTIIQCPMFKKRFFLLNADTLTLTFVEAWLTPWINKKIVSQNVGLYICFPQLFKVQCIKKNVFWLNMQILWPWLSWKRDWHLGLILKWSRREEKSLGSSPPEPRQSSRHGMSGIHWKR